METYKYSEYVNGLLKSIDQTILFTKNNIEQLKKYDADNTIESIKKSAKMSVHNSYLSNLNRRKKAIIKKAENEL